MEMFWLFCNNEVANHLFLSVTSPAIIRHNVNVETSYFNLWLFYGRNQFRKEKQTVFTFETLVFSSFYEQRGSATY